MWAFSTSKYGLGLTNEDFWCLSYREWHALHNVYQQHLWRWALERVWYANTHLPPDTAPYTVDDFLGRTNHEDRQKTFLINKKELAAAKLRQKRLHDQLTAGAPPPDWIPDWAFGRAGRPQVHG